jgi:hypothetical protein
MYLEWPVQYRGDQIDLVIALILSDGLKWLQSYLPMP